MSTRWAGRRVARDFGVLLTGEVSAQLLGFVIAAYLARAIGPTGFGIWTFAAAVVAYLAVVVEAGTDTWGLRELSAFPSRVRRSLAAVIALRLGLTLLAATALAVVALTVVRTPERRLALVLGTSSLLGLALQSHWALRALGRVTPVAAASVVQRLVFLGLAVVLVHSPAQAPYVLLWQGVSEVLAALLLLAALAPGAGAEPARPQPALVRRVASESWPIGVARALRGVLYTANVAVLARYWSDQTVGQYGAALRLTMAVLAVSTLFGMAVAPALARACAADAASAGRVAAASLRGLSVLLVPLVVGGAVLAAPLVTLVFGAEFLPAVTPLRILLVSVLVTGVCDLFRRALLFSHRQRDDLRNVAAAAALSVALNLVLVPRFGTVGGAIALVAAEGALLALTARSLARAGIDPSPLQTVGHAAVIAAVMTAVILPLRGGPLALGIAAGAAAWTAVLAVGRGRALRDVHLLDASAPASDPAAAAEPSPP